MVVLRSIGSQCRCDICGKTYITGDTSGWYNHFYCSPGCCQVRRSYDAPREEDFEDYDEYINAKTRFWRE